MVSSRSMVAGALVVAALGVSMAAQASRALVDAEHRRMQPEDGLNFPGVEMNVLGDPSKPGMYIIRRRFKPGEMTNPHFHDQDRYVTVIKGTWWTDEGDVKRPEKTVPLRAGAVAMHPAGLHHYDGAKDEEAIVQITGMGPVKTVGVDAKGQPITYRR